VHTLRAPVYEGIWRYMLLVNCNELEWRPQRMIINECNGIVWTQTNINAQIRVCNVMHYTGIRIWASIRVYELLHVWQTNEREWVTNEREMHAQLHCITHSFACMQCYLHTQLSSFIMHTCAYTLGYRVWRCMKAYALSERKWRPLLYDNKWECMW
jgi:hypothetical protein